MQSKRTTCIWYEVSWHTCNSSTQEAEAGGSEVQGHHWLVLSSRRAWVIESLSQREKECFFFKDTLFLHFFVYSFWWEMVAQRSENNMQGSILSFHCVSFRDWTQVSNLGRKHLYPLNYLAALLEDTLKAETQNLLCLYYFNSSSCLNVKAPYPCQEFNLVFRQTGHSQHH